MPRKRTHKEFIAEFYEQVENEYLILSEYINSKTKVLVRHNTCGYEWSAAPSDLLGTKNRKGTKCPICIRKNPYNKFTYSQVKNFIEIESDSGCLLLSSKNEYIDTMHPIMIKCKCGNSFKAVFNEFKSGNKRQCNECGLLINIDKNRLQYKDVKEYIESIDGYKLLSKKYAGGSQKLKISCGEGHIFYKNSNDFRQGSLCPQCMYDTGFRNYKYSYSEVKNYIEETGYTLLSKEYASSKEKLEMKCDNGHVFSMTFDSLKNSNQKCPQCWLESIYNPYQSLNIHLRSKINDWKIDSLKNCNYKCVLTNGEFTDIHHLYSFQSIVEETLEILNYGVLQIGGYSEDELSRIVETNLDLHYKYGLGVCINRKMHIKFHSLYGKRNNTSEQFEEFKTRFESGEFDS